MRHILGAAIAASWLVAPAGAEIHRVGECAGEPGFGHVVSAFDGFQTLSEICWDEPGLRIRAAEDVGGFLPAVSFGRAQSFHAPPDMDAALLAMMGIDGRLGQMGISVTISSLGLSAIPVEIAGGPLGRPTEARDLAVADMERGVVIQGFIGGESHSGDIAPGVFEGFVDMLNFLDIMQGDWEEQLQYVPAVALVGNVVLDVDDAGMRLRMLTPSPEPEVADVVFDVALSVEGGEVGGDGTLRYRNPMLAGITPGTWKSVDLAVAELGGRVVAEGNEIYLALILDGSIEFFDGEVKPVSPTGLIHLLRRPLQ